VTTAQIQLYGKRWGAVCRANGWRMDRGRLQHSGSGGAAASPLHGQVWALGEQHAAQNSRAITVEDMRKACVAQVTGRYQSAKDLTNAQFDRLLTTFRLLIEPDDIEAGLDRDDPARARERQLDRFIGDVAPEAYVRTIVRSMFHEADWQNLSVSDKQRLANILRARQAAWNKVVPAAVAVGADENEPF